MGRRADGSVIVYPKRHPVDIAALWQLIRQVYAGTLLLLLCCHDNKLQLLAE